METVVPKTSELSTKYGKSYPDAVEEKQARLTSLPIRIGQKLLEILKQTSKKTYAADSVWLLVRHANPLWDWSDFKSYLSDVKTSATNPFKRIWLPCGRTAESGLIELSVDE